MADKKAAAGAVARTVRLIVPAAKAKPSPAIGQALGQLGVNMMAFCKDFNAKTTQYKDDVPLRVLFTAYPDKTFSFQATSPSSTWFIKEAVGTNVLANRPGHDIVAPIHVKQLYEIAKIQQQTQPLLANTPLEGLVRSLASTCKGMGVKVVAHKRDVAPGQTLKPAERYTNLDQFGGKIVQVEQKVKGGTKAPGKK